MEDRDDSDERHRGDEQRRSEERHRGDEQRRSEKQRRGEERQDSDERAESVVSRLTAELSLREKVAQLGSVRIGDLLVDGEFSPERAASVIPHGVGRVTRVGRESGLDPEPLATAVAGLQTFLRTQTNSGIPALVREESLCGYAGRRGATVPQAINAASSWDPGLVREVAAAVGDQLRAVGCRVTLSPVADLALDPRWGRTEETFGEDPALAATATRSVVRGLADAGVDATPKHFVGHGRPAGGRNRARPTASLAELGDADLLPFRAAVAAGAPSLMVAYNTLDGVPCHANRALLTDLLRETWEFDGTVVSDGRGIEMLATDYGVVPDRRAAGVAALTAGVDVELPETACFGDRLVAAVRAGVVDESVVDRAVRRHLRQKIDAGLIDTELVDTELVDASDAFETDELWSLSRRAARRSQVLLSNDGTLPLSPDSHVALVGPNADEPRHLLGNYSYAAAENADAGTTVSTPRTALSERVDSSTHVRGCGVRPEGEGNIQSAVDAAAAADVTVACVGGSSGIDVERESQGTAGEALDRASLRLPGRQLELIERVAATGTPLVVVYVGGRPPALPTVAERADALLVAWLPGQAGGEAIADVLLGADPGGRLPVSLPRAVGTLPVYHWQDTVSRGWGESDVERREKSDTDGLEESDAEDSAYVFTDGSPLFPFGHGESYAAFEYDSLAVASADEDTVTLSTTVENTAERAGTTVVQLYRTGFEPGSTEPDRDTVVGEDTQSTVAGEDTQFTVAGEDTRYAPTDEWMQATSARTVRPASELAGFQRLDLDAGARVELQFDLPAAVLARSDGDGRRVVDPGVYEFALARSATDHVASVSVDLPGERRETDEFAVVADTVVERIDDG